MLEVGGSYLAIIFYTFLVPPEKPKIFDVRGQEVQLKLGPFRVGDSALIKCETWGGKHCKILSRVDRCDGEGRLPFSALITRGGLV